MIALNIASYLKFYSYDQFRFNELYEVDKNTICIDNVEFTSFAVPFSWTASAGDIDVYLVDCQGNETNFRDFAIDGDFDVYNDLFIYTGANRLENEIPVGTYYLRVTDGSNELTSDIFSVISTAITSLSNFALITFGKEAGSADMTFEINLSAITGSSLITVDWGDGTDTSLTVTSSLTTFSKTYTSDGNYEVRISGNLANIGGAEFICDTEIAVSGGTGHFVYNNVAELSNVTYLKVNTPSLSFPFSIFSKLETLILDSEGSTYSHLWIANYNGLQACKDTLTYFESNISNTTSTASAYNSLMQQLQHKYLKTLVLAGVNIKSIVENAGGFNFFKAIENFNVSNNAFMSLPRFGLYEAVGTDIPFSNLDTYNISNNRISNVHAYTSAELTYLLSEGTTYDFSDNNMATDAVDTILLFLYVYNSNLASLNVDLSGANELNNMGVPTNNIKYYTINNSGTGYSIGDTLTNDDIILTVNAVSGGAILSLTVTAGGTGHDTVVNTWSTSGSGVGADIDAYSVYAKLIEAGATITTN